MSNQGKLSNLSDAEKSVKEKQGPHEKEATNSPDNKGKKEETPDCESK